MSASPQNKRISLCMIVKDEAENLPACLDAFGPVADEWIVVDTGSTDGTPDIAHERGARVFSFPWCDDFSAARNESLQRATGDLILWVDADDRISPDDTTRLRRFLQDMQPAAVWLRILSRRSGSEDESYQLRAFPNDGRIRFGGRVHEQVTPACSRLGLPNVNLDVQVLHRGYDDEGIYRAKALRNIRLLEQDLEADPHDPITLYHLGTHHLALEEREQGLVYLARSVEATGDAERTNCWAHGCVLLAEEYLRTGDIAGARGMADRLEEVDLPDPLAEALIGKVRLREGQWEEAKAAFLRALDRLGRNILPMNRRGLGAELCTFAGICCAREDDEEGAATWLRKAIEYDPETTFAPFLGYALLTLRGDYAGARGFLEPALTQAHRAGLAQFRLGLLDCLAGDAAGARSRWRGLVQCGTIRIPAERENLGIIESLSLSQWVAAERWVALDLAANGGDDPDILVRACLALGAEPEALSYSRENLATDGDRVAPSLYRAYIAYGRWDLDGCVAECDRILKALGTPVTMALEELTQVADLFLRIGHTLVERGESPFVSYWAFATAERLYPESVDILLELARLDAGVGLYDRAVLRLRRALEQDPRHPGILQLLGSCYQAIGFPEAAEVCLQRLRDLASEKTMQGGSACVR